MGKTSNEDITTGGGDYIGRDDNSTTNVKNITNIYNFSTPIRRKRPRRITNAPPRVGDEFSHRDSIMDKLYRAIKGDQKRTLINGFGGIGKTTIARALYYEVEREFKHVAWVEYQKNLEESLLNSFKIHKKITNTEDRYNKITDFLQHTDENTIIFIDNVPDGDNDIDFMEGLPANVVLTSRADKIGSFTSFPIDFLSEDQCVDIFYRYYDYKKYDKTKAYKKSVYALVDIVQVSYPFSRTAGSCSKQTELSLGQLCGGTEKRGVQISRSGRQNKSHCLFANDSRTSKNAVQTG